MFDLRSDTVTRPTDAMRAAMAAAEVGDDVFGEDPTVNALEARAAELTGQDAALFVPSGTMGNQLCLGALSAPGSEVLADAEAHILLNEQGAVARLWGCQVIPVASDRGRPDLQRLEDSVRTPDQHHPVTRVLSLENTHNYAGGVPLPLPDLDAALALAARHELAVHVDGARLFNAAVALDVPVARLLRGVDLASICLSKGLGAPVGSLVVGRAAGVAAARRLRKLLGGGMRQAGVLAAAARLALDEGPEQLANDHRRARALAHTLAELPGVDVELESVVTNIVFVDTHEDAEALATRFAALGVAVLALGPRRLRLVFHRDAGDDALAAAQDAATRLFA